MLYLQNSSRNRKAMNHTIYTIYEPKAEWVHGCQVTFGPWSKDKIYGLTDEHAL